MQINNDSAKVIDVSVGIVGIRSVYDRHQGSNLCESTFAKCVQHQRQDKTTKRAWLRSLAKIVRQTSRQLMDPELRRTPMFSAQNRVYRDKEFAAGWRSCQCTTPCQIGGRVHGECVCGRENRHTKMDEALKQRSGTRSEKSTRHLYITCKGESSCASGARVEVGAGVDAKVLCTETAEFDHAEKEAFIDAAAEAELAAAVGGAEARAGTVCADIDVASDDETMDDGQLGVLDLALDF